jgi:hypothetical protein
VALGFWACANNSTTTTPTTPTTTTTETFEGTLNPNGAKTFPFTVLAAGTVTATLTTVSPDASVAIGLALGTWNGAACQIVLANDSATQGTVLTGSASAAGNLCTRVYDVGNLTDVASFVVTVEHP